MKTIKIKFVDFWPFFLPEKNCIYNILKDHYIVELSEEPDYVICSCFGDYYNYCQYPQVRIFYSGENYIPDFNFADYAISLYPIEYGDRHFTWPLFNSRRLSGIDRNYPSDILTQKPYFANFISSHESEHGLRGDFFRKLCEYKRVESPGTYLNNMEDAVTVAMTDGSKLAFQKKCKFTLCFESTKHEGFVTEKIADAFYADTIPIYFGSRFVKEIFNPEAFIDISDFNSFDDAINRIVELDNDDDAFLHMLRQPIFNDPDFAKKKQRDFEQFLLNIFDQPLEAAYRRSRVFLPKEYEDYVRASGSVYRKYKDGSIYDGLGKKQLLSLLKKQIFKRN